MCSQCLWIIARSLVYVCIRTLRNAHSHSMESFSTRNAHLSKACATARRAGAETLIRRGYPISELWEFIATLSPRACCRGAAAGLGLPSGLNYYRDPPKPSKLLVPATDQHLEHLKDVNTSNRRASSGIYTFSNTEQFTRLRILLPAFSFHEASTSVKAKIRIQYFFPL